jgi:hypothetical protein
MGRVNGKEKADEAVSTDVALQPFPAIVCRTFAFVLIHLPLLGFPESLTYSKQHPSRYPTASKTL